MSLSDAPTAVIPAVLERRTRPVLATPNPIITAVIMLSADNLSAGNWAHWIANIRKSLDIAQAHRYETHACGAEGTRRTMWYLEVRGERAPELRADLEHYAGYLRHNDSMGRIVWAPCSPIDLD